MTTHPAPPDDDACQTCIHSTAIVLCAHVACHSWDDWGRHEFLIGTDVPTPPHAIDYDAVVEIVEKVVDWPAEFHLYAPWAFDGFVLEITETEQES